MSQNLITVVNDVQYEDRLGMDFDHKEVILTIGKSKKPGKMCIFDSTLNDELSNAIGKLGFFETYSNHIGTQS